MDEWQWLEMTLNQVEGLYGKEIGVKGEELQQLNSEDEQYAYALDKLIKAGILPQGSLVRQLRGIIKVYKANNEIEYVVKEDEGDKLPIVLFRSQGGFTEEVSAVKEEWFAREDWGWQEYASIPLAVEWIPGDHHTMMAVPHVEILAQKFRQYLD
jgi:thioesterase domain-containing protein